ncbi:sialomucin core protein 24-like [Seriola aureovittata]|uniref:sialomucin core protein 24-like n=1 Tax=Seriola aureovittata TaxID=2871759 RepID=UPI0024BE9CAE|nr:sialomucin core protein 24-like [Seriola aureovittata]XP_056241867.1 sialomucin core protein 24-like [Seriola aureovittata]
MDTIFATVACCLLAVSFAEAHAEKMNLTITPTTPGLNLNHTTTLVTSSNTTVHATVISNISEDTTSFTSTTWDNETFNETTSHPQTYQSTTILNPLTNSSLLTTTTPGTHTSSFTAVTMPVIQSTAGYISTPDTSVITTANSSNTVNTTSDSVDRITQGFGLDISEKNMTIVFSVALGVFGVALVIFMFHRCKQKIQYLHQPLNNTDDTDAFVADDDTLIISGGLYDGHPIYDNVPTAPEDQSQFRLEFLH